MTISSRFHQIAQDATKAPEDKSATAGVSSASMLSKPAEGPQTDQQSMSSLSSRIQSASEPKPAAPAMPMTASSQGSTLSTRSQGAEQAPKIVRPVVLPEKAAEKPKPMTVDDYKGALEEGKKVQEKLDVGLMTTQEARDHFGDKWGKMSYKEAKESGAMDAYFRSILPFSYERDAAKLYYRNTAQVDPELRGTVQGEGFWTKTLKSLGKNAAEMGLDTAELVGQAIAPEITYPYLKEFTNATRRQLGINEATIQSEESRMTKGEEFHAMATDTGNMFINMAQGFKTSITGMGAWAKAISQGDREAANDIGNQMAFDLRQGLSSFSGVGDKIRQVWGVAADDTNVYVKGQPVRPLNLNEQEVAGGMRAVGGLVNSMAVWSKVSPWIETGLIKTNPKYFIPLAENHPVMFRGLMTNALEETAQATVSGLMGIDYNFGDTVFGLMTQYAMTSVGHFGSRGKGIPELKGVDADAAVKSIEPRYLQFVQESGRPPSHIELQEIIGNNIVPGTTKTWNDLHQGMARKYADGFGENRLIFLSGGDDAKARPYGDGIDDVPISKITPGQRAEARRVSGEVPSGVKSFEIPKITLDEMRTNPPEFIGDIRIDPESVRMAFDDIGEAKNFGIDGDVKDPVNIFYDTKTGEYSLQNGYHRLLYQISKGEAKLQGDIKAGPKSGDSFYVGADQKLADPTPPKAEADLAPRGKVDPDLSKYAREDLAKKQERAPAEIKKLEEKIAKEKEFAEQATTDEGRAATESEIARYEEEIREQQSLANRTPEEHAATVKNEFEKDQALPTIKDGEDVVPARLIEVLDTVPRAAADTARRLATSSTGLDGADDAFSIRVRTSAGRADFQRLQKAGLIGADERIPDTGSRFSDIKVKATDLGKELLVIGEGRVIPDGATVESRKAASDLDTYKNTFIEGKLDGQRVTSNAYIMEFDGVKESPRYGNLKKNSSFDAQLKEFVSNADNRLENATEFKPYAYQGGDVPRIYLRDEFGRVAAVDAGYLNRFRKKYGDDITTHTAQSSGRFNPAPVEVRDGSGKRVGYIMPLRIDEGSAPKQPRLEGEIAKKAPAEKPVSTKKETPTKKAQEGAQKGRNLSKGTDTAGGGKKPPEPPKKSPAPEGKPEPEKPKKASNLSTQKPKPLAEVQPQRTSRLRKRLEKAADTRPEANDPASISKFLQENFTAPIRIGKFGQAAYGVFKGAHNVIRMMSGRPDNVGTATHEVGHYIDQELGLADSIRKTGKGKSVRYLEPFRSELLVLGAETSRPSYSVYKKLKEGIAQFVRYYVTDPQKAATVAPEFQKYFEGSVGPEALRLLHEARKSYFEYQRVEAPQRVLDRINMTPEREDGGIMQNLMEALDDDLLPLRQFTQRAENATGNKIGYSSDPYVLARLTRGLDGKVQQYILPHRKPFTYDLKFVDDVRSLGDILRDVSEERLNDFRSYIVSKRSIELAGREIETGVSIQDARDTVGILEKKHKDFPALQKELISWNDLLLQYTRDGGLITDAQYKEIRKQNAEYIPFYRVMDQDLGKGGGRGSGLANVGSPVKSIKGSGRQIVDPIESSIKNAYMMISAVDRNDVGRSMSEIAKTHPDLGAFMEEIPTPVKGIEIAKQELIDALKIPDEMYTPEIDEVMKNLVIFRKGAYSAGDTVMTVLKDGKQKFYQMDGQLLRSMAAMNRENTALVIRILQKPASMLRAGATLTPEFIGRNPMRDQVSAFIYSKAGYLPVWDFTKGVVETMRVGDDYQKLAMGGAMQAAFVSMDRAHLRRSVEDLMKSNGQKTLDYFTHPIDALRMLSEFGEMGTRVGEGQKMLNKTKDAGSRESILQSAFAARNVTLDFNRRGYAGKTMNQIAAFWNASVQDMTKFGRELTGREKGAMPARTALKALIAITAPSIAAYEISKNDERYKELPRWQKDYFWIFALPGLPMIRVPKPFLPGLVFGSLPQRMIEAKEKKDTQPIKDFFISLREVSVPGYLPTALMPIIEWTANYSFFFGRDIVPKAEESLLPADQYGIYTPEVYKELGNILDVSPRKLETLVYGYSAGLGRYATNFVDWAGAKAGVLPERIQLPADPAQMPFVKAFVISDISGTSQSINDFYDTYTRAEQAYKSLNLAAKEENVRRLDQIKKDNVEDIVFVSADGSPSLLYPILGITADIIGDLRKAREKAIQSRTLSPDEKREQILKINAAMTTVAQRANAATSRRMTREEAEKLHNLPK